MATYKEIITAKEGLRKISSMDLKIKDAIKVSKLIKKLDEEVVVFYELREKICKKYGQLDEEKQQYFIPKENRETVNEKMTELESTEADIGERISVDVNEDMRIDATSLILCEAFIDFVFEGVD